MTINKNALTPRQERFVMAYVDNATSAARAAGYKNPEKVGSQLLQKPHIRKALRERDSEELRDVIASRKERQAFWTAVMRDENRRMQDRLKAAELLGKSEADFTEKRELTGANGVPLIPAEITVRFVD